jgi:uncharacterized protein YkwD
LVNQLRAENGLDLLSKASDATAKAKQHSDDMAAETRMYHSGSMASGLKSGWSATGENVAMGGSVGSIESNLEQSAGHRQNMLNAEYNQIGVGVSVGDDGMLYVTEVFVGR